MNADDVPTEQIEESVVVRAKPDAVRKRLAWTALGDAEARRSWAEVPTDLSIAPQGRGTEIRLTAEVPEGSELALQARVRMRRELERAGTVLERRGTLALQRLRRLSRFPARDRATRAAPGAPS